MKLLIASGNKHKIYEFRVLFEKYKDIEVLSLADLDDHDEVEENGTTFSENAFIKAKYFYDKYKIITISDDSGICVPSLNNEPGIYSSRYSGFGDEANNDLVLEKLVNETNRTARYTCALCIFYKDGSHKIIKEHCYGKITHERMGNGGFGYDPLFFVEEINKTFGQVSLEEKNKYSHRAKALRKLREILV